MRCNHGHAAATTAERRGGMAVCVAAVTTGGSIRDVLGRQVDSGGDAHALPAPPKCS